MCCLTITMKIASLNADADFRQRARAVGSMQFINVIYRHCEQQQLFLPPSTPRSLSVLLSICCIYPSACHSLPPALCVAAFICGIVFCVWTRFTLRDYVVTGDTIGTLDEEMHLSVLLIPCFKSLFTPCSLPPHTGTRTWHRSLWHAASSHTLSHEFRNNKSNKRSLMALWVCVRERV